MAELQVVVLAVAGSSPVDHPTPPLLREQFEKSSLSARPPLLHLPQTQRGKSHFSTLSHARFIAAAFALNPPA